MVVLACGKLCGFETLQHSASSECASDFTVKKKKKRKKRIGHKLRRRGALVCRSQRVCCPMLVDGGRGGQFGTSVDGAGGLAMSVFAAGAAAVVPKGSMWAGFKRSTDMTSRQPRLSIVNILSLLRRTLYGPSYGD